MSKRGFSGTCFGCGKVGHSKSNCFASSKKKGTVECYDCHAAVQDLKQHRTVCPNSRASHASLSPAIANVSVTGGGAAASSGTAVPAVSGLGGSLIAGKKKKNSGGGALVADSIDWYAIVDVSSSMEGQRIADAKKALLEDIVPKMKDEDRMALVTFDTSAYFKLKPRAVGQLRRQDEIDALVGRIFTKGCTAIWDAICMSIKQVRDKTRHTIMTVLTDGEDNSSRHTYDDVLALLDAYPNVHLSIVHVGPTDNEHYVETARRGRGVYRLADELQLRPIFTATFELAYAANNLGGRISLSMPLAAAAAASSASGVSVAIAVAN